MKNLLQFDSRNDIVSVSDQPEYKANLNRILDLIEAKFANMHRETGSIYNYAQKRKRMKGPDSAGADASTFVGQGVGVASTGGGGSSGGGGSGGGSSGAGSSGGGSSGGGSY